MSAERVAANLNRALHTLLESDPRVYMFGEDLADPYGGAFAISRGLSTRFPGRVLSTPLSEGSFVGLASGMALCGDRPIVEVMFADFLPLCFDQIFNFASKSVAMYGRPLPMHLMIRAPVGGRRGYGPTHSQHPLKHFLGIPHLAVYELTSFRDSIEVLRDILDRGEPCLLFEDKVLYTRPRHLGGIVDELFRYELLDDEALTARVFLDGTSPADSTDVLIVAPGGVAERCLNVLRWLLIEDELCGELLVPTVLYPIGIEPMVAAARRTKRVCVVEESTPGATWGAEVARLLHERLWNELDGPVRLVNAAESVIPAAPHLECQVLPSEESIYRQLRSRAGV